MNNKFKSGVSLITVLLFMLTATIAATAVYKWITSASMASADRLKHTEVYLASESGVETLRSWLEYHGADAGALIKEYTDNGRYPICMDSILRPLAGVKSENFSVYLVGVDVASYPYKLKFVSTGTSRNSSKYSQVVIFDVNGLYQVKIPTDDSKINFTQAFYGLAGTLTDQTSLSSAIINGNVTGNTPSVTGNLLITGNYSNGGSTTVGGDLYVGGTFSPNSQTIVKGDCYFGSTVTISSSGLICMGDAYFNGNVSASGGYIDVKGNATFNGSVYTGTNSSYYMNVNGNVVMGASGVFNLIGSSGAKLNVGGSTWSPNEFTGTTGGASGMIVKLGDSTTASNETYLYAPSFASSLRTKDGYPGYYKTTSVSGSDTTYWVYSKSVYKGAPSGGESAPFEGGDSLSSYTKLLSDSTSSCVSSGTKNVPDPIIFKDSAIWLGYANPSICALPTTFGNDFVTKLNGCYAKLYGSHQDALYNGFLVVRMTVSEKKDPSGTLAGKFIIILDASNQQVSIPPTTSTSAVMLYLPKGAYQLLPGPSDASDAVYNYLIYSKGDISQIQNFSGTIRGSIFMAECSKVGQIQGSLKASYNKDVLKALSSAGVIQNNPKYNSGSDSTSTSTTGSSTEKNDPYYIPISPRLRVTLESEYTNNEFNADTLSQAISVDPSIIVFPRIVYLTTDAPGKLKDYISIVNLNGATENGNGTITCDPSTGLNTSMALDTSLEDIYKCKYTPSNGNYNTCPFYVVVDGTTIDNPEIAFTTSSAQISPGTADSCTIVTLTTSSTENVTVDMAVSSTPSNWKVTQLTTVGTGSSEAYSVTGSGPSIQAFSVCASAGASGGSMLFLLARPCNGCSIGSPSTEMVSVGGTFKVDRADLDAYVAKYPASDEVIAFNKRPDCDDDFVTGTWVYASGSNCSVSKVNEEWVCYTGEEVNLEKSTGYYTEKCEVLIPEDNNTISATTEGDSYTLYGGIKLRAYKLMVDMTEATSSNTHAKVTHIENASVISDGECSGKNVCSFDAYYGLTYSVKTVDKDNDDFSYYECSGYNCPRYVYNDDSLSMTISTNDTVKARFGVENHCFDETFESAINTSSEWTSKTSYYSLSIADTGKSGLDGYAYFPIRGSNTFMLRTDGAAGYDGMMSADVRAYNSSRAVASTWLNTGLVFRSNIDGTSYYQLTMIPKSSGTTGLLRLCYETSAKVTSSANCIYGGTATSSWSNVNDLDEAQTYTISLVLAGDTAKVTVSKDSSTTYIAETKFYLRDSGLNVTTMNETDNQYVGFKLADVDFRFYDISWKSLTYGCSESPTLYCSFKANYPAAVVPKGEYAAPWAYVTLFCDTVGYNCCTYRYHTLNSGATAETDYYDSTNYGYAWSTATFDEGSYVAGTVYATATCNNGHSQKTFSSPYLAADCGAFTVGELDKCSENYTLNLVNFYYFYSTTKVFSYNSGTPINMRSSVLTFDLNRGSYSGNTTHGVYVRLIDSDYHTSSWIGPFVTTLTGNTVRVDDVSDKSTFNPEKTKWVEFYDSTYNFTVSNVASSCPYAMSISDCSGYITKGTLSLLAKVSNASSCSVTGTGISSSDGTGLTCGSSFTPTFDLDASTLSTYSGQTLTYTITAANDGTSGSCTADVTFPTVSSSSAVSSSSVVSSSSAAAPSITSCPLNSGTFTAYVANSSSVSYTYAIAMTDVQGNIVSNGGSGTTTNTSFSMNYTPTTAGSYIYSASITYNGTTTSCSQTYTVASSSSSSSSVSIVVSSSSTAAITATCAFASDSVVVGNSVNFNITTSGTTSNVSATLSGNSSSYTAVLNEYYTAPVSVTAPTTAGTYIYSLSYNGETLCSQTLTVIDALSCSASSLEITLGENFTFAAIYGGSCYSSNCSGSGASCANCSLNNTITPVATGSQIYTYNITSGSVGTASCSKTVSVKAASSSSAVSTMSSSVESSSSSSPIAVTLTYGGDYYDFEPGETYLLSCASGTFTCSAAGGDIKLYLDGSLAYTSFSWQSLGNYQSVVSCSSATGKLVTVSGGTMRCMSQW